MYRNDILEQSHGKFDVFFIESCTQLSISYTALLIVRRYCDIILVLF